MQINKVYKRLVSQGNLPVSLAECKEKFEPRKIRMPQIANPKGQGFTLARGKNNLQFATGRRDFFKREENSKLSDLPLTQTPSFIPFLSNLRD